MAEEKRTPKRRKTKSVTPKSDSTPAKAEATPASQGRARSRGQEVASNRKRGPAFAATDPHSTDHEHLRLSELMRPALVKLSLTNDDQWGAVEELIEVLVRGGELDDSLADVALSAVNEREAIRPTGWKCNLAFPNGRVEGLKRIVAAIGLSPAGVEFGCLDRLPAKVIVLLLFPASKYARFSPAINDIADTLEDSALREAILTARQPEDVVDAIEDAETRDFS